MEILYFDLVDDNTSFSSISTKISLECHVTKEDQQIGLCFHPLSSYFHEKIYEEAKKKWQHNNINICYNEEVPVNKFVFASFKSCAFE